MSIASLGSSSSGQRSLLKAIDFELSALPLCTLKYMCMWVFCVYVCWSACVYMYVHVRLGERYHAYTCFPCVSWTLVLPSLHRGPLWAWQSGVQKLALSARGTKQWQTDFCNAFSLSLSPPTLSLYIYLFLSPSLNPLCPSVTIQVAYMLCGQRASKLWVSPKLLGGALKIVFFFFWLWYYYSWRIYARVCVCAWVCVCVCVCACVCVCVCTRARTAHDGKRGAPRKNEFHNICQCYGRWAVWWKSVQSVLFRKRENRPRTTWPDD